MEEKETEIAARESEVRKERQALLQKMDRMEEVLKKVADVLAANTNYALWSPRRRLRSPRSSSYSFPWWTAEDFLQSLFLAMIP